MIADMIQKYPKNFAFELLNNFAVITREICYFLKK